MGAIKVPHAQQARAHVFDGNRRHASDSSYICIAQRYVHLYCSAPCYLALHEGGHEIMSFDAFCVT